MPSCLDRRLRGFEDARILVVEAEDEEALHENAVLVKAPHDLAVALDLVLHHAGVPQGIGVHGLKPDLHGEAAGLAHGREQLGVVGDGGRGLHRPDLLERRDLLAQRDGVVLVDEQVVVHEEDELLLHARELLVDLVRRAPAVRVPGHARQVAEAAGMVAAARRLDHGDARILPHAGPGAGWARRPCRWAAPVGSVCLRAPAATSREQLRPHVFRLADDHRVRVARGIPRASSRRGRHRSRPECPAGGTHPRCRRPAAEENVVAVMPTRSKSSPNGTSSRSRDRSPSPRVRPTAPPGCRGAGAGTSRP